MFFAACTSNRSRALWLILAALGIALAAAQPSWGQRAPVRDPNYIVRYYPWSYRELQQRGIVMQKLDYSCGAAVLATIGRYYWGDNVGEKTFLDLLPDLQLTEEELKDRVENGLTLTDLRNLANKAGYDASMGRLSFDKLTEAKVPVIVGIIVNKYEKKGRHEHFAVYRGFDGYYVYLADPIRGQIRLPGHEFLDQWQRNAILAIVKRDVPVKDINPMGIRVDEVDRGWLNEQTVRKNYLSPQIPNPLRPGIF